ncbi:MAG: hypothetical protein GEU90_15235 [Gemmatimonas sp.]|nr:hypothetical protein [Gemmatimonas sp.]
MTPGVVASSGRETSRTSRSRRLTSVAFASIGKRSVRSISEGVRLAVAGGDDALLERLHACGRYQDGEHPPVNVTGEPVVIAGAGPVGLSLALALAERDVPVRVFERLPTLSGESRASTFHPSTLELFAGLHVANELVELGYCAETMQYRDRATGAVIVEFDFRELAEETAFPFRLQVEQSTLTAVLLKRLLKHRHARVEFGRPAVGATATGDGAAVRVAHLGEGGGEEVIEARFVVGTDGAHSAIRPGVTSEFPGFSFPSRFVMVFTTTDVIKFFVDGAPVIYLWDTVQPATVFTLRDHWRTVFQVDADESEAHSKDPKVVEERLVGLFGERGRGCDVRTVTSYRLHQRIVPVYRNGGVVLAGDAAHLNAPLGGMGMNCGIHDAFMLADVLSGILAGAPEADLDTYSTVRRKAAETYVFHRARENYQQFSEADAGLREKAIARWRSIAGDPSRMRTVMREMSMLDTMPAVAR